MTAFNAEFTLDQIQQGLDRSQALAPARRLVLAVLTRSSVELERGMREDPAAADQLLDLTADLIEHARAELALIETAAARVLLTAERIEAEHRGADAR